MSAIIQIAPDMGQFGFVNRQKAIAVGTTTSNLTTPSNYASINSIEARLTAINAGYYTPARLNQMTVNDKVFAVRSNDDANTI